MQSLLENSTISAYMPRGEEETQRVVRVCTLRIDLDLSVRGRECSIYCVHYRYRHITLNVHRVAGKTLFVFA